MTGIANANQQHSPNFWGLPLAMAAATLILAGCGGDQSGGTAGTDAAPKGTAVEDVGTELCDAAENAPSKPDAQLAMVVVDHTASARTDVSDPPNLNAAIAALQAKGLEEGSGSQVQTLNVTSSGQFPSISKPLSLDLKPGDTSPNAEKLRQRILHDCVPGILKAGRAQPPAGDTDLLGALLAANQQKPVEILVISSGLNSTAQANLTAPAYDPAQVAESVKKAIPEFASWTVPVTWFDLGEPNPPLSAPDRDRLISFWKDLLGKKLNVDTRE